MARTLAPSKSLQLRACKLVAWAPRPKVRPKVHGFKGRARVLDVLGHVQAARVELEPGAVGLHLVQDLQTRAVGANHTRACQHWHCEPRTTVWQPNAMQSLSSDMTQAHFPGRWGGVESRWGGGYVGGSDVCAARA